MIKRTLEKALMDAVNQYPVVTITGPRQSGKTTLVKKLFKHKPYFNLEDPVQRSFAREDPVGFLNQAPEGAVIDEIQRVPELTSNIQVIVDQKQIDGMFILTGSYQYGLCESVNQSLAGRTAMLTLLPFDFAETEAYDSQSMEDYILRGFYPRVYDKKIPPHRAYSDYYETYIERDLRQIINIKNLALFEIFVKLCAGRVGQIFNAAALSNEVGVSQPTIKEWLSILESSYIIFRLRPYHANLGKRLVKSPKLYFHDVGLAAWLLGIEKRAHITTHPLRGNLFENMMVSEVLKSRFNQGRTNNLNFYRDGHGNEIDIIYNLSQYHIAIELKSGETINSDSARVFSKLPPSLQERSLANIIAYAGITEQKRNDVIFCNYLNLTKKIKQFL